MRIHLKANARHRSVVVVLAPCALFAGNRRGLTPNALSSVPAPFVKTLPQKLRTGPAEMHPFLSPTGLRQRWGPHSVLRFRQNINVDPAEFFGSGSAHWKNILYARGQMPRRDTLLESPAARRRRMCDRALRFFTSNPRGVVLFRGATLSPPSDSFSSPYAAE
jgi:hypothetical protein